MNSDSASPRRVLPIWRAYSDSVLLGELASQFSVPQRPVIESERELLRRKVIDHRLHPSVGTAVDVLSTAYALGEKAEIGTAIDSIRQFGGTYAEGVLQACVGLGLTGPSQVTAPLVSTSGSLDLQSLIRRFKARARSSMASPILYTELARSYLTLGQIPQAKRAITCALGLAPTNRFVLRAAVRFFVHADEQDYAYQLLIRSGLTRRDPWLLAGELAVADILGVTSKNVKHAKEILDSKSFHPYQSSELAASLGTLESFSGNSKLGRKLLIRSLEKPAENAVAQAQVMLRSKDDTKLIEQASADAPRALEASARVALLKNEWANSLSLARCWQREEPFSSRPAILASSLAAGTLDDHVTALEVAELGLRANPDDVVLLNNMAFSLALKENATAANFANARAFIHRAFISAKRNSISDVILTATSGLVAIREGDLEGGKAQYLKAIDAADLADPSGVLKRRASMHLAVEVAIAGGKPEEVSELMAENAIAASSQNLASTAHGLSLRLRKSIAASPPTPILPASLQNVRIMPRIS